MTVARRSAWHPDAGNLDVWIGEAEARMAAGDSEIDATERQAALVAWEEALSVALRCFTELLQLDQEEVKTDTDLRIFGPLDELGERTDVLDHLEKKPEYGFGADVRREDAKRQLRRYLGWLLVGLIGHRLTISRRAARRNAAGGAR